MRSFSRSAFLSTLEVFLTIVTLAVTSSLRAENKIPDEYKTGGFFVGCQACTFKNFTVFEAIEKTAAAGGKIIELYPGQKLSKEEPAATFDQNAWAETIQKVKDKLAEHKIKMVNYGVVQVPQDEAGARKLFGFAKTMGLRAITTESVESIDLIEKMVKEYDIMVGFHGHWKNFKGTDYRVWDPNYILSVIKDRDRRRVRGHRSLVPFQSRSVGMFAHSERADYQQPPQGLE